MSKDGFDLEAFLALKKEAERLRRDADRAEGRLASLLDGLKGKFGLDSVEKAKQELSKREELMGQQKQEYGQLLAAFEEANKERLGG